MNFEFMTIDTPLPPCMPFPRALTGFPVSSTAKVMYCRMLDAMLSKGQEDENGILFVCFPVTAIAAVLSRYQHINPVWFSNALTHSHDQSGGFQFIQRTLDRHGAAGQDCGNGCDREADKQDSVLVLLSVG